LNEEYPQNTSIDKSTDPVIPEETGHGSWEDDTHHKGNLDIISVLPNNDGILVEVGDVCATDTLGIFYTAISFY
jgi:hypothetical protein